MTADPKWLELFYTAGVVSRSLDSAVSILRQMQASIPLPSLDEVEAVLQKKRPLTPEIFIHAMLLLTITGVEGMASNLRTLDPEKLSRIDELDLSSFGLDAMKQRLEELRREP